MQINENDRLLTVKDAAQVLCTSASHLNKLRCYGGGPEFIRVGAGKGGIRYQMSDLKAWIQSKKRRNTSEAA
ncbi:helix-turn-helix transcriptional regulator [Xanthobacter versatilis]|uniref:helix-turn-helix transcriptional regulator n=1 Tax=Xanthobacter autotrophicus (strain ATCC BAA-1158 / Py2) TaxID=78245 RepID=UPI0037296B28